MREKRSNKERKKKKKKERNKATLSDCRFVESCEGSQHYLNEVVNRHTLPKQLKSTNTTEMAMLPLHILRSSPDLRLAQTKLAYVHSFFTTLQRHLKSTNTTEMAMLPLHITVPVLNLSGLQECT